MSYAVNSEIVFLQNHFEREQKIRRSKIVPWFCDFVIKGEIVLISIGNFFFVSNFEFEFECFEIHFEISSVDC